MIVDNISVRLSDFGQFLRANGVEIDTGSVVDMQRVASLDMLRSRQQLMTGLRACACRSPADWRRFDHLFDLYWRPLGEPLDSHGNPDGSDDGDSLTMAGNQKLVGLAGTSEKAQQEEEFFGAGDFKALSLADFRFVFNPHEMRRIEFFVEQIARRARRRVTRREQSATRGHTIDLRKSNRESLRFQGHPMQLRFRKKRKRMQRFVLLLDISQSMDVYAKLFLRFSRILMSLFHRSDAFAFNTELTPLGRGRAKLTEADFEFTLNLMAKSWLGGTRIAESFETFNEHYLSSLVDSKTTLVVFSDGCDTAKPERLAKAVSVMQRRARKLVWVNPLLGRFEPGQENRWMDPVEPYTDVYCSAHNLESLIALERQLLA